MEQNHAADPRDFALPELSSSDRGFFGQALEGITADGELARPVKNQTLAWIDSEEIPDYPFPSVNHKLFAALSFPCLPLTITAPVRKR